MAKQGRDGASLRSSMVSGSAWMVAMRWAMRGIGLVSTVILVRLLAPEDFGLVAMSTLFIALLEVFTSLGVDLALIQRADSSREHYDTAWTIRLIQAAAIALFVFAFAPFFAEYFNEPRVTALTYFLAVGVLVAGFENIGVVAFRKELDFAREFRFMVLTKVVSFVITISLALWWRSYWALAWGIVGGRIAAVSISYVMHHYRPRLSLARFKDLWSFSQWMLLRNIGMYLRKQVDSFLVARFFDTGQMGYYSVAKEVAELPTSDLVWPMARALFPGYALMAHDPKRLGRAFLNVCNMIALISIPTGVGLALVAEPLVAIAFGERWSGIAPTLAWLAVAGAVLTISAGVQAPLMALGRMRRVAALVWAQLLVAVPILLMAAGKGELVEIAKAQFLVSMLLSPVFFYAVTSIGIVSWSELFSSLWRPVVASAVMWLCISFLPQSWMIGPFVELALKVPVGTVAFISSGFALWAISGRPDGGERLIFDLIRRR